MKQLNKHYQRRRKRRRRIGVAERRRSNLTKRIQMKNWSIQLKYT